MNWLSKERRHQPTRHLVVISPLPDQAETLKSITAHPDVDISIATTYGEANSVFEKRMPDAIIIDAQLVAAPGILDQARAHNSHVCVVVYSFDPKDREEFQGPGLFRKAGVNYERGITTLASPFLIDDLKRALQPKKFLGIF